MIILFQWTPAMPPVPTAPPPTIPTPPVTPNNPFFKVPKAGILGLVPSLLDLLFPAPTVSQDQEQDAINKAKNKQKDYTNGGDWVLPPQLPFNGGQCVGQYYDVNLEGIRAPSNTIFVTGATNVIGPIEGLVVNSGGGIALKAAATVGNPSGIYPWFHVVCTEQTNCVNPLKSSFISKVIPKPGQTDTCGNPPPLNVPTKEKYAPPLITPDSFPLVPTLPQIVPSSPLAPPTNEPDTTGDNNLEPKKVGSPLPIPQDSPLETPLPVGVPFDFPIPNKTPSPFDKIPSTTPIGVPTLTKVPGIDTPISFDPTKTPDLQPSLEKTPTNQTDTPDLCELIKNCSPCNDDDIEIPDEPESPKFKYIQVTVNDYPKNAKIILGKTSDESIFWAGYFQVLFMGLPIGLEYPIRRIVSVFTYPDDSKYSHKIIKTSGYTITEIPLITEE